MPTLGSMVYRSLIVCLHASFKSVARSHPKFTWLPGELVQPAARSAAEDRWLEIRHPRLAAAQES